MSVVAALALLVPVAATAQNGQGGEPFYAVTGGGQVIADATLQGAGDTIAFVAQALEDVDDGETSAARGELQVVQRPENGNGEGNRPVLVFHGRVTCVVPGGANMARFGGEGRDPRPGGDAFEFVVDVTRNDTQGNDMVLFREYEPDDDHETPCDDEEDGTQLRDAKLARGKLQIHDRRS